MPCRVGITTDPARREQYWRGKYPNLRNWLILGRYSSRDRAQRRENLEARKLGCAFSEGGKDPSNPGLTWHVYYFKH